MGSIVKTAWADDVEDFDTPRIEESIGPDGIRTVIEYTTNEEGKKVKIARKTKQSLTKSTVDPVVATPESDLKKRVKNKTITCRLCRGAHFTAKCPYRDTMDMDEEDTPLDNRTAKNEPAISASAVTGCVYKPLVCFGTGARGARESTYRSVSLEDMHTLRVTNVSEETDESDLRDLFGRFGRVLRVYIAKDRETGVGKGYAFVGFENKADAEKAIQKTNGMGYDNLILSVCWSQPKEQR